MARRASRTGFTIVELLIVVVVIAILAAITIVAYNGITNRAKNSAASSAAESAAKKVMTFAVTNSDSYPATLADSGVTDGNGTTYQYRVDNTANPKTFCVTATANSVSYFVSSANATPTSGACAGHGANGIAPVTNWSINPSFETMRAHMEGLVLQRRAQLMSAPRLGVTQEVPHCSKTLQGRVKPDFKRKCLVLN